MGGTRGLVVVVVVNVLLLLLGHIPNEEGRLLWSK